VKRIFFFVAILTVSLSINARLYASEIDILVERTKEEISQETKQEIDSSLAQASIKPAGKNDLKVYWKHGVHMKTADENVKIKIGGRIQADTAWMKQDTALKDLVGKPDGNAEFRRARLYISGDIYKDYFFKAQYDFADGDADFKNVYLGMKHIPFIGTFKVGHFKEPFSLEELTSSNYITFLERGLPNVFAPSRNMGLQLNNTLFDKRLTWAAGVFRQSDDFGFSDRGGGAATGRITGLPIYKEEGRVLLHVGAAYSLRDPRDDLRYRERPETHLSQRYVDTYTFDADYVSILGLETALVYGSFSLQSELMQSFVDQSHSNSSHTYFPGVYVYGSYFLTGENRAYHMKRGCFTRVKPLKKFSIKDKTWGAWEVTVRYSYLDLKDKNILGGIVSDVSVGLNWYWNPCMRVMGNYVHSNRNSTGSSDILEGRFQINF